MTSLETERCDNRLRPTFPLKGVVILLTLDKIFQAQMVLRGIVRERIAGVISGVTDISITADAAIMDEIGTLGDRLKTMSDMSALESDLAAIIRRIGGA